MTQHFVGMLSGTSVDSIDVVLVAFPDSADQHQPTLLATYNHPWPEPLRAAIFASRGLADEKLDQLDTLDHDTATVFAEAALQCIKHADVDARSIRAIGSHGQTIRHRTRVANPFSLQFGKGSRIAELTGIDVVADFRSADIAAGGEGAPLASALHQAVFRSSKHERVILNIGGIANITVLPAAADAAVSGFDTGPGNNLMDAWTQQHRQQPYDRDGAFAASGKTDAGLLARCLTDPYFALPAPKSTGFEQFNPGWLQSHMQQPMDVADVQSTLCDLTVTSILRDINRYAPATDEIFVCGGGAHNTELMRRLQAMSRARVASTEALGVHPDWVEAITFAWLARQHVNHLPGNIPSVTGASAARVLGELARSAQ